jgi:hypothetical protein
MSVKLNLWHWRWNTDRGCLKAGCWGEYFVQRDMKWQETRESCIIRSFITCTLPQVWLEWLSHGGWDGQGKYHEWDKRNEYRILVSKPEVKRPLGRPKCKWLNTIKTVLREIGWCGIGWIDLAQDRDQRRALVTTVINLRIPWNPGKFLSSCTTGGFLWRPQLHGVSQSESPMEHSLFRLRNWKSAMWLCRCVCIPLQLLITYGG